MYLWCITLFAFVFVDQTGFHGGSSFSRLNVSWCLIWSVMLCLCVFVHEFGIDSLGFDYKWASCWQIHAPHSHTPLWNSWHLLSTERERERERASCCLFFNSNNRLHRCVGNFWKYWSNLGTFYSSQLAIFDGYNVAIIRQSKWTRTEHIGMGRKKWTAVRTSLSILTSMWSEKQRIPFIECYIQLETGRSRR